MRIFERVVWKQELSLILKPSIRFEQFAFKEGLNTTGSHQVLTPLAELFGQRCGLRLSVLF